MPNDPVIATPENYGAGVWHNSSQTITATFTPTSGCDEKLQYRINSGDWTDGESVTIAA
ncbi:MAG: hypothetical protein GX044_09275 [Firmicutes bacterium]|jgi:hypothetical protein|nr:hypothetical protein [Bacillota bacterium]